MIGNYKIENQNLYFIINLSLLIYFYQDNFIIRFNYYLNFIFRFYYLMIFISLKNKIKYIRLIIIYFKRITRINKNS